MSVPVVVVAVLLFLGVVLRRLFKPLRLLYIPGAVVAGFVGLLCVQLLTRFGDDAINQRCVEMTNALGGWPGPLIAIVFAAMMLQSPETSGGPLEKSAASRIAKQGLMVWIIVLGETFVGLLATAVLIQPFFDVPNSFGMLIETGFAGGHGTAGAMGVVFSSDAVNLEAGLDLGMLMATCGLVYGVVSGIVWINLGSRWGWFTKDSSDDSAGAAVDRGKQTREDQRHRKDHAIGYQVMSRDMLDPLLLQAVMVGLAVALGMLLQFFVDSCANGFDQTFKLGSYALAEGAEAQLSQRLSATTLFGFPLFIYTMLGGWTLRRLLRSRRNDWLDNATLQRIGATAMEVLVVAAITSLRIETIVSYAAAFTILFIVGAIWTAICLMLISRWVLPRDCWFPLGLINYGMSTGTTATGFVLLRVVDPELKTTAANDYALAVPISAPFVGGGILTIALPLLVLERVSIVWPTAIVGIVVVSLIVIGWQWNRQGD